jgi:hypothetical protein
MGWNVMTIWECQLKKDVRDKTLREIEYDLNKTFLDRVSPLTALDNRKSVRYGIPTEYHDIAAEDMEKR